MLILKLGLRALCEFQRLIDRVEQLSGRESYVSAGTLQYFDDPQARIFETDSWVLYLKRNQQLAEQIAHFGFADIVKDHYGADQNSYIPL